MRSRCSLSKSNLAYQSQLLEMKDQISMISMAYNRLQADHETFQTKDQREEAKGCSVDFAANITLSKFKVAEV